MGANLSRLQSGLARLGWLLPIVALVLLLAITVYLDGLNREQLQSSQNEAAAAAEREASSLAEDVGAEIANRIGALAAAKIQFTQVEDSLSQELFVEALDSVIAGLPGLTSVTVIYATGFIRSSSAALLDRRGMDPRTMPGVAEAYERAIATRRPAATGVIDLVGGRRFIVFDPVVPSDTAEIDAVLAAELQPLIILRSALEQERDYQRPSFYQVHDPTGTRITTVPAPPGWPTVERPIRVADTEWRLVVAHQPVSERPFEVISAAIRISGIIIAIAFAISLLLLWRTVTAQQEEIAARKVAENRARESAGEAARRAREARDLTAQLESAQQAALRLSGALDPDQVIDEFLGVVGEAIQADVALLYTFDETGDAALGRRRVVLDPELAAGSEGVHEDFEKVRVPTALVRHLAEPAATGEPFLAGDHDAAPRNGSGAAGLTQPTNVLTVPLAIGGKLVGLAVWETYRAGHRFDPGQVPFARAVSAHAAASLRASELLDGVRRARERARREAVRLATVLEQMSDGVVLVDQHGRPERVNAAATALLGPGLERTRLSQWPTTFNVRRSGHDLPVDAFLPVRALEGVTVRDTRFTVRYRGTDRYISASAAPIRGQDESVRGAALVLRDVTDEHEYAEMLRYTNQELRQQATLLERANDEMRAATAAKDQFLAMMSHELRTPINAIIGYSDLLDMGVHGGLNQKQRQMLNRVTETSRHLLGLITDVLDLTKIGAGRIDLEIQPVHVAPVVRRAADQVTPLADGKGLRLEVHGDGDLVVRADETRLLQILINLASNAVKFTEEGSVELHYRHQDDLALIHVRDTGPGIPEPELDRVFEEFYQVDAGLARKAGGTGLGLAISRRLARLMGGDLTVDSEPDTGAVFTLVLPIRQPGAAAEAERSGAGRGSAA